jgi:hypothetical protein
MVAGSTGSRLEIAVLNFIFQRECAAMALSMLTDEFTGAVSIVVLGAA